MLKVFLVEDETIVREGLRDIIPWQQYGFTLVGDAGDGEQALPMIREMKPDVLITDIKMPFMDGLALSNLVNREFPDTKIIIISGYDDFEYARQAIAVGASQYLLKPITKTALIKTLNEVQQKISAEQEQKDYREKFRNEMQEYEQFARKRFFEELVSGQLSVGEIYEKADQLNIPINAQCYNLILYSIQGAADHSAAPNTDNSDLVTKIRDGLTDYFLAAPEYLLFRWNLTTYALLVRGGTDQIESLTGRCVDAVRTHAQPFEKEVQWYVAFTRPTNRLSSLPERFETLNHIFSYRHLMPEQHILTNESTASLVHSDEDTGLQNLDMMKIDPTLIHGFLVNGQIHEVEDFVGEYLESLGDGIRSKVFQQYLMLNVRFTAVAYLNEIGHGQDENQYFRPDMKTLHNTIAVEDVKTDLCTILLKTLELREQKNQSQGRSLLHKALEYIDQNYADESISLGTVAAYMNVTSNYFSALFSQEMEQTFVEYLTEKRMHHAKELLRSTEKRTAEIAAEVGYKDPHYFSFVFRKTQDCTPREYRTGGKH